MIGEKKTSLDLELNIISIDVEEQKHDKAPAFGEPTDFENKRWPSYTSWSEFSKFAQLHTMFYNPIDGLLKDHPGAMPILYTHKRQIDSALYNIKFEFPNSKAGYSPIVNYNKEIYEDENWPEVNNWLTRLEWLKYWIDWSLENCKEPIFTNS